MCGISCIVCDCDKPANNCQNYANKLKPVLQRRGPNATTESFISVDEQKPHVCTLATVLGLRGLLEKDQFKSNLRTQKGCTFLWNGEVFAGDVSVGVNQCDTDVLFETLCTCSSDVEILSIFKSIKGPYAFIFMPDCNNLWFGRDYFGRRSLLWSVKSTDCQQFLLSSSVDPRDEDAWQEVPAVGIFKLDLHDG